MNIYYYWIKIKGRWNDLPDFSIKDVQGIVSAQDENHAYIILQNLFTKCDKFNLEEIVDISPLSIESGGVLVFTDVSYFKEGIPNSEGSRAD